MLKKNETVFSPHVFRAHADHETEHLPILAPEGRLFYLVTPSPHAPNKSRKYLYEIKKNAANGTAKIMLTHSRQAAKKFNNLRLAEAFADFLASDHFLHEHDFWIVLEPSGYREENLPAKSQFVSIAEPASA